MSITITNQMPSQLTAISPLDGRYADKLDLIRPFFSEFALLRYRLLVEIRWLQTLADIPSLEEIPSLSLQSQAQLEAILEHFNLDDAAAIKAIEAKTNHDVKALEYFLKEAVQSNTELQKVSEFIHFACTSEDINNLSYALILKEARQQVMLPLLQELLVKLAHMSKQYADIPMLSRTHGQPASPTTLGKEMVNVVARLQRQTQQLREVSILGKINGAVGNFNAHYSAYPELDWPTIARQFVEKLGLMWNPHTTQIEPHDYMAEFFHVLIRCNNIVLDLNRDLWSYIALGYFKQTLKADEVGSSTMPHKVNPIDFENSEGNLGLSTALLEHMATKLPISRWQRDLSDSTVLRNLGVAIGYAILAYQSTLRGLNKLEVNREALYQDLERNWEVLAEAIQTVMRRYGLTAPYEQLKTLTRGKTFQQSTLLHFIDGLNLPQSAKDQLKQLTPHNYLGNAIQQAHDIQP